MINWIKFFTLGFFSDKLTSEAPRRKYYNPLAALIIAFILFVAVIIAADFVPFSLQYGRADDFQTMVHSAFTGETRIQLKVDDGKILAEKNGAFVNDLVVNSFTEDKDYSVNGYNLVVDTRPMTSYDEFEVEFNGGKITSEDYEIMTLSARKSCTVKIVLTDRVRELDDAFIEKCTDYLEKASSLTDANYDKAVADKYEEIKSQADVAEKNKKIYALYLQAYYPQAFNENSGIPILRNYYAQKYIENEEVNNYLFVFEDMLVGSFTSGGTSRMFYGYTSKLDDGLIVTAGNSGEAEKQVDKFIDSAYRDSLGISSYLYFINARRIFLFVIIIWLVLALIAFAVARLVKLDLPKKFGAWFKISGSFIFVSSIITCLIAFICCFFVSTGTIFSMITPLFAGIIFIRFSVYFVLSCIRANKKSTADLEQNEETKELSL